MALPARDHRIPLAAAAELARRYREGAGKDAVKAQAFHADQVMGLLTQPGCAGLRIYYGTNPDGSDAIVLVGLDAKDQELTGGVLLEFGFPCPPVCTDGSALNG